MGIGDFLGKIAAPAGAIAGGLFEYGSNRRDIGAAGDMIGQAFADNPYGLSSFGGGFNFGSQGGQFQFSAPLMAQLQAMQMQGLGGLQGQGLQSQLFEQANLQNSPAFLDAQQQLATQFNPDLNVEDIIQQNLEAQRAMAKPEEDRAYNRHRDVQQATGAAGTTGGGIQTEAFARGLAQADNQRILNSQQFGANLQNQLFGQALQGQQQNISQGSQRLKNMIDMFGLRSAAAGQDQATGLGMFGQQLGAQQYSTDVMLQSLLADAQRRSSQGKILEAQMGLLGSQQGQNAAGGGGLGGLVSAGLSMFSDARLKQDIELAATVGDINFYNFRWRPHARNLQNNLIGTDFGVIAQEVMEVYPELVDMDERSGYYIVDYSGLKEVLENG